MIEAPTLFMTANCEFRVALNSPEDPEHVILSVIHELIVDLLSFSGASPPVLRVGGPGHWRTSDQRGT
jgi:hypothetical protein